MTALRKQSRLFRLCTAIINGAALLAPKSSRADWKQEWMAEISCKLQVCDAWGRTDTMTQARLFYRSLGSFIDAFILRWDFLLSPTEAAPMALVDRHPLFLGLAFFVMVALCRLIALPCVQSRYGFLSREYYDCYWALDPIVVFALFGIILLVYRCALLGSTRIWGAVRMIFAGLLVITFVLTAVQHRDFAGQWWLCVIAFEQNVIWLSILLSLTLLIAVRRLESADDLALPVYGILILLTPDATEFIGVRGGHYFGGAAFDRCWYHYFIVMHLFRWVSISSTILAFVVWGYAYGRARRSPRASSRTK
jgi:hypothetical protein